MKSKIKYIAAAITLAIGMVACDKIDEKDRWVPDESPLIPEADRSTVLIEEYTGQHCVNCPEAAKFLHKETQSFSKNVIIVSMHAMRTGQTTEQLASDAADQYSKTFDLPLSIPGIMINRTQITNEPKYTQKKAVWPAMIRKAVNTKATYSINLKAELKDSGKKVKVTANPTTIGGKSEVQDLGIQLWVVEDIRALQTSAKGKKDNYFHHNVLRGEINGLWGAPCKAGQTYSLDADMPAKVVKPDNAKVVAYLFNRKTNEILEASIVALGAGIKPEPSDDDPGDVKPTPENEGLSFHVNDKPLASGSEVIITEASRIKMSKEEFNQMETPLLYVIPGKKGGKGTYAMEISKEDHIGTEFGGLFQVCAGGMCFLVKDTEKYTGEFKVEKDAVDTEQSIQIHYKINEKHKEKKDDYRVRVSLKQNNKEVAYLRLVFKYDPASVKKE
ncbi:Omp28 family outer membrane lipoprotein [Porphyromonas pogonae]|uniref:Omp28 family outer membrane lipoprotein n=1 Tax=Porphyromonas pogonae TaxID=867595 RepID=UPI002E75F32B|nr:Omp28 family outer membrane lipoprotein [Porphyromonas pogonae]